MLTLPSQRWSKYLSEFMDTQMKKKKKVLSFFFIQFSISNECLMRPIKIRSGYPFKVEPFFSELPIFLEDVTAVNGNFIKI